MRMGVRARKQTTRRRISVRAMEVRRQRTVAMEVESRVERVRLEIGLVVVFMGLLSST